MAGSIYLDSAAIVKLVHAENETRALRAWLDEHIDAPWTSSTLLEVEAFRALARYAPEAASRLHPVLDLVNLVDIDAGIRILAQTVRPATVRSLDAVHLATGLRIQPEFFITYDKRLADAAREAGLAVETPGA
ncbi:type II toxin-antitoxin system VapC family toxin [Catenulispora pinisilvae]|uniref:type II toxin-antitoxin system VapC family toxin n=1 Tax=Catenulispora pinisilvae TaxID=2705253 RepID=UPI001891A6D2|nr:type II toxin-antitoxin system VapC family toxin [Catenulispora pinisilvae]